MMKLLSKSVYVGPNLYSKRPVIRLALELPSGGFRRTTEELPAFLQRLAGWPDASWMESAEDFPTLLALLAMELQKQSGSRDNFFEVLTEGDDTHVLLGYDDRETGIDAAYLAFDIIDVLKNGKDAARTLEQIESDYEDFLYYAEKRALGPSTLAMIQAAEARGIPWFRLNDQSLVQFGWGKRQQRIEATVTSRTSLIAADIAANKELTNKLLADLGLPVPKQQRVNRLRRAQRAAEKMGFPLVVKPSDGNHGRGVSIGVSNEQELEAAYDNAKAESKDGTILLETVLEGFDHRLLVVNGELIAAARRMPAHVKGDGRATIKELVEKVNSDPRRGIGHEKVLTMIDLDQKATALLEKQGFNEESVPKEGELVILQDTANLSSGGTAVDVTNEIHPDNILMAERAIKTVGLDIGGVDFLCKDIARSFTDPINEGCGICEINAGPGFRMHVAPSEGKSRDVAGAVVDMLFPEGSECRIPVAALTGTNGKTTTSRMLAHIMRMDGYYVGLTTTDAVYINGKLTVKGDMTGPTAANIVLRDPSVDFAVLETARGGILRAGLGYPQCDVGAVLNVSSDHLGLGGIDTLEQLAVVKRLLLEVTRDTAVINADDPICLEMVPHTTAKRICFVSMDQENPVIQKQKDEEKRAVVLEKDDHGEVVVLYDKGRRIVVTRPRLIPATLEGKAIHNTQNAMFALAMAYSMGAKIDNIAQGLRTFDSSFYQTPGRLNIYDEHPFKVILDYGHNPAAIKAMVSLVERMQPRGKRWILLTSPGDRRDQDMIDLAKATAGHFDHYICHDEDQRRGREAGEVSGILARALRDADVDKDQIEIIEDEESAVDAILNRAQAGDLVLLFADNITRTWKQVIYFGKEQG